MNREAIKAFHEHIDKCSVCEQDPFNLCPEGERLIKATLDVSDKEIK